METLMIWKTIKESLGPSCGPSNKELCDEEKQKKLEEYMAMPISDLQKQIEEQEALSEKAEEELAILLKNLQEQYEAGQKERDRKQREIKDAGLGLLKSVQAHKKHMKSELCLGRTNLQESVQDFLCKHFRPHPMPFLGCPGTIWVVMLGATALGLEVSQGDWEEMTAGKAVFLKFFTPWCGQCKDMKPAWDALMEEYKDDDSVLVAEVDCVGTGKAKCKELDVQAYPEVKYGDPNNLEAYTGGKDLPSLQKFVQELTPTCGPERLDWCDNKRKRQVQGYMDLPPSELNALVKKQEDILAAAQKEVDDELEKMQKEYAEARHKKELKVQEIRLDGLGLMKMVQAHRSRKS
eukprot:symbB.v1.2.030858.t1/scaffold3521.1/size54890/3